MSLSGSCWSAAKSGPEPAVTSVYAPVGLPWQDLALTWLVYRAVVGARGVPAVDLLS